MGRCTRTAYDVKALLLLLFSVGHPYRKRKFDEKNSDTSIKSADRADVKRLARSGTGTADEWRGVMTYQDNPLFNIEPSLIAKYLQRIGWHRSTVGNGLQRLYLPPSDGDSPIEIFLSSKPLMTRKLSRRFSPSRRCLIGTRKASCRSPRK